MSSRPAVMNDQLSSDLASLRIARDEPPRPFRWGRLVAALVVLGGLGAGAYFAVPAVQAKLFQKEVELTEVTLVSPAQASVDLTSTGYVVPQKIARVGPKVSGRITKVAIKEGQRVAAGAIIFELDPSDQKSAITSAEARVASARARAAAARARAQAARANVAEMKVQWERQKNLAASGAVAASTAEDLEMRVKALEAQVVAADVEAGAGDAESIAAQAEVKVLVTNLGNMTIPAPIDGEAVSKPSEVGDVVVPATTLVELADFTTLMVETDVPEGRVHLVKKDAPAEIILDAYPDRRFKGAVAEISPRLNRAKATATVKVRFVGNADVVLPEMSARVSFLQEELKEAELKEPPKKVIAGSAIVERGGAKHVFVFDGGRVRLVPVSIGAPFAGGFQLLEGPGSGTRVVKNPPADLADGQTVKERSS